MTAMAVRDRTQLLRKTIWFQGVPDLHPETFGSLGVWKPEAAKTVLFQEGDYGDRVFVIAEGLVSVEKEGPTGKRVLAVRSEGDVVGEMALLDGKPRSATAVCQTDCLLLSITKSEFERMVSLNPKLTLGVLVNLLNRLRESDDRYTRDMGSDSLQRLAGYLMDNGQMREGRFCVSPRPSDADLGRLIRCTRETVNRKLGELERKGILTREPTGIVIENEDALEALTNPDR